MAGWLTRARSLMPRHCCPPHPPWREKEDVGLTHHSHEHGLIARWTEAGIQYHLGRTVPEAEVLATLGGAPAKSR